MYTLDTFKPTDENFQTMVTIWNAGHDDEKRNAEMEKYIYETRSDDDLYFMDLIVYGETPIGFGLYGQNPSMAKAKKFFAMICIHPEHAHQDKARQFYLDHMCTQVKAHDGQIILLSARENYTNEVAFIEANAFKQVMRYPISALDVQAFDPTSFEERIQKVQDSGIEIITLAQLKAEHPDTWEQESYDLIMDVIKDIPMPTEFVPPPIEEHIKRVNRPNTLWDGFFIAREGGQCVGVSSLVKDMADDSKLLTALTGVLRSHRRRRIALALKVHAIKYAKAYGAKVIETDNEENNPMYQINMQLGFEPKPAYLDFEKSLI